jgi:hypothetical protein
VVAIESRIADGQDQPRRSERSAGEYADQREFTRRADGKIGPDALHLPTELWHAQRVKRQLLLALWLVGCGGGKDQPRHGTGLDGGGPTGPGSQDDDDGDDLPPAHTECLSQEPFSLATMVAKRLPPAAEGTSELPLTADGCVRLVRTVQGGQLRELAIRRWSGYIGFDPGLFDGGIPDLTDVELKELEYTYVDWKLAPDGSLEARFNLDGTDTIDARLSESYAEDRIARQEFTRFTRSSGEPVERRTLSAAGEAMVHYKVERAQSGPLTTVAEFDASRFQRQNIGCYSKAPMAPSDTVPCSDEFKQKVRDQLRMALERSVQCFEKYEDGWSIEQFRIYLFQEMYGNDIEVECFQSDEYVGEMDVGSRGPKLRINAEIFKCEQPDYIDATLFHEVMHRIRGPHDVNDNELDGRLNGFGARSNAYTDSIRGCEELCFGTIKTACSCAACFESDTCDSRCSELPGCIVRDPMGNATMSEAVGALCRDPANVPAEMKKSTWHPTMMDCESSCAFGAAQCKSYSLSCDDNCQ